MTREELLKVLIVCMLDKFCKDKIIRSLDDISIIKTIENEKLWDAELERNLKKRSKEYGVKVNGKFYSIYGEPLDVIEKGVKVYYIDEDDIHCEDTKKDILSLKQTALESLTNQGLYVFIG
jgi:hypothetical protein